MGRGHLEGVYAYLNNPKLRKAKKNIYFPQDLILETPITKLEFQDDSWNITEEIK